MTPDSFALLGFERRPWLDPEAVKDRFHELSRTEHPDQPGGTAVDFALLNQAHATLRDPKARLRHLLELEFPEVGLSGPSNVPAGLADKFVSVHTLLRQANEVLAKKNAATSSLAKALLAREELAVRERVEEDLADFATTLESAEKELQAFDARWASGERSDAGALRDFYQRFAYLSRWTEQLRERLFQLGI